MRLPGRRGPAAPRRPGVVRSRVVGDRGMVTAELALALPALLAVLGLALWVLAAVSAQLRCTDAAAGAARAAARGEAGEVVRQTAARLAPHGAAIEVRTAGDSVEVLVRGRVHAAGLPLPPLEVSGRAVALLEPGVAVRP